MSGIETLYIGLCALAFILIFAIGRDEPLGARFVIALTVAFFWLPVLIVFALMLLVDAVAALIVRALK